MPANKHFLSAQKLAGNNVLKKLSLDTLCVSTVSKYAQRPKQEELIGQSELCVFNVSPIHLKKAM
jgi:hypothetical protein